ncbi:ABC transporter ATP-binding protein [Adhaeribacter pallidiroseus]|uniref:Monosaccharide-transporting ATPase n=1 Tax=Adhaeribacter pallidiroseus TaxID=2072847 RepID=A0A369QCB1_9BACT|nr:ABC transporter ATP-binding protein [Adhaeribacter pallidiroseus]RDC62344.1 Monosaccharide-transporting ATPase [Adhaeribacter pallidiroseus]
MTPILQINNLSKKYGTVQALNQVSFTVEAGSVYGLLGPNGSGKTTTLGIVLDVLQATSGTFQWFGEALSHQTKRRIGAILETPNFYPYMSAAQNLQVAADVKKVSPQAIPPVLEMVGLLHRQNSAFKSFSLGMKQRLALAAALLNNPEVLVLDEPTNGLDPQGIAEVRELILKIASQGKTIIIASHLLDEVEKVCTHVAVLQTGKLRAAGSVTSILAKEDQVIISLHDQQKALALLPQLPVTLIKTEPHQLTLTLQSGFTSTNLNQAFFANGLVLSQLQVKKKSLESQFLQLTNNPT